MGQAVSLEPNSFHHWMWLRKLYQQAGDDASAVRCAREGLRCLDQAPDPSISPEERTRLVVRASLSAGEPARAKNAIRSLEALRRRALEACPHARTFGEWYEADRFAAPIFETLLELWQIMGDPEQLASIQERYRESILHAHILAVHDDADNADLAILKTRISQLPASSQPG